MRRLMFLLGALLVIPGSLVSAWAGDASVLELCGLTALRDKRGADLRPAEARRLELAKALDRAGEPALYTVKRGE